MELNGITRVIPNPMGSVQTSGTAPEGQANFLSVLLTMFGNGETEAGTTKAGMQWMQALSSDEDGSGETEDQPQEALIDTVLMQQASGISAFIAAEDIAAAMGVESIPDMTQTPNAQTEATPTSQISGFAQSAFAPVTLLQGMTPQTAYSASGIANGKMDAEIAVATPVIQSAQSVSSLQTERTVTFSESITGAGQLFETDNIAGKSGQADDAALSEMLQPKQGANTGVNVFAQTLHRGTELSGMRSPRHTERLPFARSIEAQTGPLGTDSETVLREAKATFESSVFEAQKLYKADMLQLKTLSADKTVKEESETVLGNMGWTEPTRFTEVMESTISEMEEPVLPPKDLLSQVTTGISSKLDMDEREFVVKLKPEGLGEITVEMIHKDGKIVLNIIASSAQTEKLLTSELAGLRDSLRMYNAEIQQVTSAEADSEAFSSMAGHDLPSYSEERLDQWHFADEQRSSSKWPLQSDEGSETELSDAVLRRSSVLLSRYA